MYPYMVSSDLHNGEATMWGDNIIPRQSHIPITFALHYAVSVTSIYFPAHKCFITVSLFSTIFILLKQTYKL